MGFDEATRRIVQYRIRLEREARWLGPDARAAVDACYRGIEAVLRSARVEMEGAGAWGDPSRAEFVGRCHALACDLFVTARRETSEPSLCHRAFLLEEEARRLMERLLERALLRGFSAAS